MANSSLHAAVLAVQKEAPTLEKNATNPHFRSKFCSLDTIVETIGPIMNRHGLVWTTFPTVNEHGQPALKYRLVHAETGEAIEDSMALLLSKPDPQGQGSAITYARRYAICAVLNLVADDDDDGHRASSRPAPPPPDARKRFRMLINENAMDEATVRRLFASVSFVPREGEKVNDAINRMPLDACAGLVERIKTTGVPGVNVGGNW